MYGHAVVIWGTDAHGAPYVQQLLPEAEGYVLRPLHGAPPAPEALARLDARRLGGWWAGRWQVVELHQ
jgi:hypothetical protein